MSQNQIGISMDFFNGIFDLLNRHPGSFLPAMFGTSNHIEDDDIAAFLDPPFHPGNAGIAISATHQRLLNEPDVVRLMEPGMVYSVAFHDKRIIK